jgi:hypothetical protein
VCVCVSVCENVLAGDLAVTSVVIWPELLADPIKAPRLSIGALGSCLQVANDVIMLEMASHVKDVGDRRVVSLLCDGRAIRA